MIAKLEKKLKRLEKRFEKEEGKPLLQERTMKSYVSAERKLKQLKGTLGGG